MPNKVDVPNFQSEAEEATWWDSHPEVVTEIMSLAVRAGTARRSALKTVTMRIPESDLAMAQQLADQKGLPYQTYIKVLLHEALTREASKMKRP